MKSLRRYFTVLYVLMSLPPVVIGFLFQFIKHGVLVGIDIGEELHAKLF